MEQVGAEFELKIEGSLLLASVRGTFDPDSFARYQGEIDRLQQLFGGQPWAVLMVLSGDMVVDFDLARQIMAAVTEGQKLGRKATAVVLAECVPHAELVQGILSNVYRRAAEPCEFFSDAGEARDWLQAQLSAI